MKFSVTITRSLLYRVVTHRIFRYRMRLISAYAICLLVLTYDLYQGKRETLWFSAGALLLITGIIVMAWWRGRRAANDWLRRQGDNPILYDLSEYGVKATSQMGSLELKWEVFERLTIDDHLTLLHYPQRGQTTLPTDQIPPAALEMLSEQFLLHGKPVVDKRRKL